MAERVFHALLFYSCLFCTGVSPLTRTQGQPWTTVLASRRVTSAFPFLSGISLLLPALPPPPPLSPDAHMAVLRVIGAILGPPAPPPGHRGVRCGACMSPLFALSQFLCCDKPACLPSFHYLTCTGLGGASIPGPPLLPPGLSVAAHPVPASASAWTAPQTSNPFLPRS
jgi:hypothetical protein